ncbi:MAG: DUF1990 family protein [Armatimonadota bacterium]
MIEISEKTLLGLEKPTVTGAPEMMTGRALIEFNDSVVMGLGDSQSLFDQIADHMMRGDYYPPEIIVFEGEFRRERRDIRKGDRILQLARLPFLFGYRTRTVTEISVAERRENYCRIGYYTTSRHFAKGWWQATLKWEDDEYTLMVECQARPQSLVYWLAVPVARYMQERARKAAMSRFATWV